MIPYISPEMVTALTTKPDFTETTSLIVDGDSQSQNRKKVAPSISRMIPGLRYSDTLAAIVGLVIRWLL